MGGVRKVSCLPPAFPVKYNMRMYGNCIISVRRTLLKGRSRVSLDRKPTATVVCSVIAT